MPLRKTPPFGFALFASLVLVGTAYTLARAQGFPGVLEEEPSERTPEERRPARPVYPPPSGPKKRIAVAKFDAMGKFTAAYGSWDIGGGLAAQLTTALVNSGHFIVVERAELASVLREQTMGMQGVVTKESAAKVGKVLGAQILVRGSVTEFDQRTDDSGFRIGIARGPFGGGLGLKNTTGHVAIDLRLIDTTTGQVLQSRRAESRVKRAGIAVDINVRDVSFGGDQFNKTPLGQASRQAIEKAVLFVIRAMQKRPWTGRVVAVTGDRVYINAGRNSNIRPGDLFAVTAVSRQLIDPSTGLSLGAEETTLGEIEVVTVKAKFSIARKRAPFQTKRGDFVKYRGR